MFKCSRVWILSIFSTCARSHSRPRIPTRDLNRSHQLKQGYELPELCVPNHNGNSPTATLPSTNASSTTQIKILQTAKLDEQGESKQYGKQLVDADLTWEGRASSEIGWWGRLSVRPSVVLVWRDKVPPVDAFDLVANAGQAIVQRRIGTPTFCWRVEPPTGIISGRWCWCAACDVVGPQINSNSDILAIIGR
jgi:hypothetical protein